MVDAMCPRTARAILLAVPTAPIVVTGELYGTLADATTAVTEPTPAIVAIRVAETTVGIAADGIPGAGAMILGTASVVPPRSAVGGPGIVKSGRAAQRPTSRTNGVRAGAVVVALTVVAKRITSVAEAHHLDFVNFLM